MVDLPYNFWKTWNTIFEFFWIFFQTNKKNLDVKTVFLFLLIAVVICNFVIIMANTSLKGNYINGILIFGVIVNIFLFKMLTGHNVLKSINISIFILVSLCCLPCYCTAPKSNYFWRSTDNYLCTLPRKQMVSWNSWTQTWPIWNYCQMEEFIESHFRKNITNLSKALKVAHFHQSLWRKGWSLPDP